MLFEIKDKKKADIFSSIFQNLKGLTDKINMNIELDHMYIQGMDNSHICIFDLTLKKEWFDIWEVEGSEIFGLNLIIFNKLLNTKTENQSIKIYNETQDKLEVTFKSDEKGDYNKYFQIPLMDLEIDLLQIPDIDYDVDIHMEIKKFKDTVDQLQMFNDVLDISCNNEDIVLLSEGIEGTMKVVINMDDIEEYSIVENEETRMSFALRYISTMCQFHKVSKHVKIHISKNLPIQLKYELEHDSMLKLYLAPKISDD